MVDDDASIRLLCRINLELEGFRVAEAESVAGAREAVAGERPGVVVLDLLLGADDAGGLLDELHDDGLPVILLTGTTDAERYAGRASEVLPKPFEPLTLVGVAKELANG